VAGCKQKIAAPGGSYAAGDRDEKYGKNAKQDSQNFMSTRWTPSPSSARGLALDILATAARRGRAVEDLLAATLARHPDLSRQDRGLLLELVQGVKRWEIRLDFMLSQLCKQPLKRLHPLVLQILRLGAYQLLRLDQIPPRAVLHESGNLAKARRLPRSHVGLVNAVLRRLAAGDAPPLPDPDANPLLALSVRYSHPTWLVARWLPRWGLEKTAAHLAANNRIPPLTARINALKTDSDSLRARLAQEGVQARAGRFSPMGLIFQDLAASPTSLASYREGLWLFQDEAAQVVTSLLPCKAGARLTEIGAGRGGKTTHLAETLGPTCLLVAVDHHAGRLRALQENLRGWGVAGVHPVRADAAMALPEKKESMDAVVLDVPCSALGILRRHPEIKSRLREPDLATFPPRQAAMLEQAAPVLRARGHLLYITCTAEPEENELQIERFLAHHPEFHLDTAAALLPEAARELVQPPGYFRSTPEDHDLDGFFAAVLRKT
jgi:16S rRNA (cytosine967-C5)-methyltransferase